MEKVQNDVEKVKIIVKFLGDSHRLRFECTSGGFERKVTFQAEGWFRM